MEQLIEIECEDCGEEPEVDEKQSNENWKVFKNTGKTCKCGGKFKFITHTK